MKYATQEQIIATLRYASMMERNHKGITYEDGVKMVDLVAHHGDKIANAWEASVFMAREIEKLRAAISWMENEEPELVEKAREKFSCRT